MGYDGFHLPRSLAFDDDNSYYPSLKGKQHGGVCVFFTSFLSEICNLTSNLECIVFKKSSKHIVVATVYRTQKYNLGKILEILICKSNELPLSSGFSRENMILAAICQGKDKPPFSQYMCAFGEQMCKLYVDGMNIKPFGSNASLDVRLAVFVGTMDLQAKAYVLNKTMHNGEYGCSACEESGASVRQGK
ncbi:Hypothetical predicted protein [Mytilus galloprovincialis]|uniref:Uncharacterized protein n=1 Tax=Mytilus galloprovincialis TaxID=29158 RepID=A0A8B6HQB5_MYTGA|nr:Hypothetical predicted protein [Mytilus galloprovincialis]